MSSADALSLFVNEALVDELWTILKREGLPLEKVREVSAKVAGTAKFGLGKLWQWMATDSGAELKAEAEGKTSQTFQYTSAFRALLLPELLPEICKLHISDAERVKKLMVGNFVEITCDSIDLVPVPTLADFIRQYLFQESGKAQDEAESKDGAESDVGFERAFSVLEKYTSARRAFTFMNRLDGFFESKALKRLFDGESSEMLNALSTSNDDHTLALTISSDYGGTLVFSMLDERFLRRSLGVFSGNRQIRIFGNVAYLGTGTLSCLLLGIQPISVSLA